MHLLLLWKTPQPQSDFAVGRRVASMEGGSKLARREGRRLLLPLMLKQTQDSCTCSQIRAPFPPMLTQSQVRLESNYHRLSLLSLCFVRIFVRHFNWISKCIYYWEMGEQNYEVWFYRISILGILLVEGK